MERGARARARERECVNLKRFGKKEKTHSSLFPFFVSSLARASPPLFPIMHRLAAFLVDCNLNDNAACSLAEALREVGAKLSLSSPAVAAAGGPEAPRVGLFVASPPNAAAAEAAQGPRRLGVSMQVRTKGRERERLKEIERERERERERASSMTQRRRNKLSPSTSTSQPRQQHKQVLIKPSAFEPRDWFQKVARLPELATAGPFGGEAGASALSEAFSTLVAAAEASSSAAAAAAAAPAAAPARPPVAVPGYSQRTAVSLMRVLDLIRESKGGGGSATSRFDGAAAAEAEAVAGAASAAAAAAGGTATAAEIDAASPPPSSPLATIYVITHALSDPGAFAPALRAAAADRVGVS